MNRLKKLITVFAFSVALMLSGVPTVFAQTKADVCQGVSAAGASCTETGTTVNKVVELAINTFNVIVGIVAVVMIIIGGFKYITSSGDSSNIQSAKNTILFAIVGLIIVAMAKTITGFVLSRAT